MSEVIPAYGRDYKTMAEVMNAWNSGHDFFYAWCGGHVTKSTAPQNALLQLSYDDGRRHVAVKT